MDNSTQGHTETSEANEVKSLPLVYTELDPALALKAREELNETEENIEYGLIKLKELIAAESVPHCTDDEFLTMFLRSKKYDLDRSFKQLKNYSRTRRTLNRYFSPIPFERIKKVLDLNVVGILPKRDKEGRAIIYVSASNFSSGVCDPEDAIATTLLAVHFVMSFPATQVNGFCFIADTSLQSLEALRLLFKYTKMLAPDVGALPARIKRIDCYKANFIFRTVFSFLRTFFPSKIFKRSHGCSLLVLGKFEKENWNLKKLCEKNMARNPFCVLVELKLHRFFQQFYTANFKKVTLIGDQPDALLNYYSPFVLPEEMGGSLGRSKDLYKHWVDDFEKFLVQFWPKNAIYENVINQ